MREQGGKGREGIRRMDEKGGAADGGQPVKGEGKGCTKEWWGGGSGSNVKQ